MHCRKLYMLYPDLEENLDRLIPVGSIKNEVLKDSAKTKTQVPLTKTVLHKTIEVNMHIRIGDEGDPLQEDRT